MERCRLRVVSNGVCGIWCFAKQRFQEGKKLAEAGLVLRVAACGSGGECFELAVDLGLCLVVDTPIGDAVGLLLGLHHVVHLAPVFKFLGMFPFELGLGIVQGEAELHQLVLPDPGHDALLHGLPDFVFSLQKNGLCAHEWAQQYNKEGYGKAYSQGGTVG